MPNKKSRIILDTNLWISFLLSKDFAKLDKLLFKSEVQLLFSEELLEEFISVTKRPKLKKYFDPSDIDILLETFTEVAEFVNVKSKIEMCRDYKDNFLLSLAVDGNADYLLTGDKDLLVLEKVNKTSIVTIQEYLSGK